MRKRKHWDSVEIVSFVCLTALAVIIVIPFWNAVVISFETAGAYARSPFSWLPGEFTLENYKKVLETGGGLVRAYWNTIKLAVIGTLLGMTVMVMTAYAFSREFPGKRFFFMVMLFTMFFGGGLVPTYLLIKNLKLLNNSMAIVMLSLASCYNIIIMKNSFESIPQDLVDAARIDGAHDFTIFVKVMLPLQKPMIATFSLFTIVGYWNNWYWPMLVLTDSKKTLLQVYLRSLINNADRLLDLGVLDPSMVLDEAIVSYSLGIQMAGVFLVMLPIMLVYPFLQKHFTKGVLVGGVKM